MAKSKVRPHREIGLKENDLCPHCGMKVQVVRYTIDPSGEYVVFHWFNGAVCVSKESVRTKDGKS